MAPASRVNLLLIVVGLGACGLLIALSQRWWEHRGGPHADATSVEAMEVAHQLLRALADVDYRAFVAPTGGSLKKLPENAFLQLVLQHSGRLRQGYELKPLDKSMRRGVEMIRWRVVFAGGGKDATLTVGTSGGTVRLFTLW